MDKAVIYWPGADSGALQLALAHCRRRRYGIDSIVPYWDQAIAVVRADWAQVVVIGTRGDLDPRRVPRWEIADEWPDPPKRHGPDRRPQPGPRRPEGR